MRRLLICLLLSLSVFPQFSFSNESLKEFDFPHVEILDKNGFHKINLTGLKTYAAPGNPKLPVHSYNLVLPAGEILSNVQIVECEWITAATDVIPTPGSEIFPISQPSNNRTPFLSDIYSSKNVFPDKIIENINTDFYKGHSIGRFTIQPVRWNPLTRELEQIKHLSLSIKTTPDLKAENALVFLRQDKNTLQDIKSLTSCDENLTSYASFPDDLDEVSTQMIIICDSDFEEIWQGYADFKNRFGVKTTVLTTDQITISYTGADLQEKIRNAIIDYYASGLEYILLGGDVQFVPFRYLYGEGYNGMNATIPADIYYAGLDGDWNSDADRYWGEPGEDDLYQEISIGRASVSTAEMAQNWINKQISYQTSIVETEITEALMIGEELGWNVSGSEYKEEINTGSSANGYTTVGFPNEWNVETRYASEASWTVEELLDELNSGHHYINHMGHCDVTIAMGIDSSLITNDNLTNNGINHNFYLLYSQGCYCGAFDEMSIMEKWNNAENGAFAIIANSRSGYGSYFDTDGVSQRFDREFFDAIFGENIFAVGEVNRDSKHDNIDLIDQVPMRYVYYEINLFGDPSVKLYSSSVQQLQVNFPPSYSLESNSLIVTSDSGIPYHVAVSRNNVLFGTADSDNNGVAEVALDLVETGNLEIVVTAHNCIPIFEEIPIITNEDVYPVVNSIVIDDSQNQDYANGQADYGESFLLGVEIQNVGSETINSLDIQVFSESNDLMLDSSIQQIGPISSNELDTLYVEADVAWHIQDLSSKNLRVEMKMGSLEWTQVRTIRVHAPRISCEVVGVNDELNGNGNHRLDPGEQATLYVHFSNSGSSDLINSRFRFLEHSDKIQFVENNQVYQTIRSDTSFMSEIPIQINISSQCENPDQVYFTLQLEHENTGFSFQEVGYLDIGGLFNDVEIEQGWQHYSNNEIADQWHVELSHNHTAYGEYSWKAGGVGSNHYMEGSDCCLELPAYYPQGDVLLSFYHKMDAELYADGLGYSCDGGWIEISLDGYTWVRLDMPGYNYLSGVEFPIGYNHEVYSGTFDWIYDSVLISDISNALYIRFRFASSPYYNYEGWCVDDISISGNWGEAPPCRPSGVVEDQTLSLNWSMPGYLPEGDMPSGYYVYRNDTVISSLLSDPSFEDNLSSLSTGIYDYAVRAVYNQGQSDISEAYTLDWILSTIQSDESIPETWAIYPPYPNPFNPSFAVKVDLKQSAKVKAQLYNVLGKRVRQMEAKVLSAGSHTLSFDNSNLSSGIYFVSILAGPETKTFKVVMIK